MDANWAVGVDVGGSLVRAALVEIATGRRENHVCEPTRKSRSPEDIVDQVASIIRPLGGDGPVGVALPGVIRDGVVKRVTNLDRGWVGRDAAALLRSVTGRPVTLLNDADAAGLAEVRHGAGRDREGTVVMLTFGTGLGSALIVDGKLVHGTELGHLQIDGSTGEHLAAARAIRRDGLSWIQWAARADRVLAVIEAALNPDLLILGGGISHTPDLWLQHQHSRTELVIARFRADAGVVGAALTAQEKYGAVTAPRR